MGVGGIFVLLFFCAVLGVLAFVKTPLFSSPTLQLFRAFFPSWKFFDDAGYVPRLFYRVGTTPENLGEWKECLPKPQRKWCAIFWNPEGNYLLAAGSLLDQLASDVESATEAQTKKWDEQASFQLTRNLVRAHLSSYEDKPGLFQFKLCLEYPGRASSDCEDILVSEVERWG